MRRGAVLFGASAWVPMAMAIVLFAAPANAQDRPPADWKQQWDAAVAAAKKERELIISAPSGRVWRDALMEFQKAYPEIELKITAAASREFWPRVLKENEVGQYLWDIRVGGPDNLSYDMKARGLLDPMRQLLILPDVVDDNLWHGGLDGMFTDNEKRYMPTFALYEQGMAHYNKKFIKGPVTVDDVIKPEFTGKISMADPRGGSSLATMGVILKFKGEDFVKTLIFDRKPVITNESRQQMQWLASGRYPITFGLPTAAMVEYAMRGASIDDFGKVEGLISWTQGVGGLQLPKRAPHPNAVKVLVNWILTKDVQEQLMSHVKLNSRRKDVPIFDPIVEIDPARLDEYVGSQMEEMQSFQDKATALLRGLNR